ncbi:MAG: hypothetical protein OEY89_11020 [Gammaproteobacteria bacterium]|nr:hypothetical protein [Gammaproteobacteria bacterium]
MKNLKYTATKSSTSKRPGWSVSFRHPLRTDVNGKPGLKVRRGLGTTDEVQADELVGQLNQLLQDDIWWNATKRAEAETVFSNTIVNIFYDDIQAGSPDTWSLRENEIPLPGADVGYSRVLFVGTTGAGKTSLLRHLIGSDPEEDRFPSTSTAKTTISDIEVIQSQGAYQAVVTFFSEHYIQANVEDCITKACVAAWEGQSDKKIAEKFLSHDDQKFRLSYILGSFKEDKHFENEDEWAFEDNSVNEEQDAANDDLSANFISENLKSLTNYLERIKNISSEIVLGLESDLGENLTKLNTEDKSAAEDLFEERVQEDESFNYLTQDVLDDIKSKIQLYDNNRFNKKASGWPITWKYETDNRNDFIKQVRWFSSNYAGHFGKLLTPIVDGVRVKGPLYPVYPETNAKLVLLDGQGLGHTPDSSSSVTTHITRKFKDVDVILLVDNAQQPMQAAPLAVMRAVAASGYYEKLAIAFTHFDQVSGDNLPTFDDKKSHVLASVNSALNNLKNSLGSPVIKAIEKHLESQSFMLGGMQYASKKLPKGVINQLNSMTQSFIKAITPPEMPDAKPVYVSAGLDFAVQAAADTFQQIWQGRLGLKVQDGVKSEHWTRVKALNRRIAGELDDEYDSLQPVADLVSRLSESISRFLDNPTRWTSTPKDNETEQAVISNIRRSVYTSLHEVSKNRLITNQLNDWRTAYSFKGAGSTSRRSLGIRSIYETAAPVPSAIMTEASAEFLEKAKSIVYSAIKDNGGEIQG